MSLWAYPDAYDDGAQPPERLIRYDYYEDQGEPRYAEAYESGSSELDLEKRYEILSKLKSDEGYMPSPSRNWKSFYRAQEKTPLSPRSSDHRNKPPSPSPAPEYLETSLLPSSRLDSPTSARKLLILDLNGTLLVRGAHSRAFTRDRREWNPNNSQPPPPRPLRPVHPRPYLPAFASFLFHPQTKAWLDTMVWSSAQPHSVHDMVNHCFGQYVNAEDAKGGEGHSGFVAIWARDTLGLDEFAYHNKTQTTKDLAKPWAELPHFSSSSPSSPIRHSALSTLLLDDSPLKAHLQPYNHVCIREYVQEMRAHDLRVLEGLQVRWRDEGTIAAAEAAGSTPDEPALAEEDTDEFGRKRKRKEKKLKKQLEKAQARLATPTPKRFDETLLAVIGVLDALKWESNVAGWLRAGGLLRHTLGDAAVLEEEDIDTGTPLSKDAEEDSTESDLSVETLPKPFKKLRQGLPSAGDKDLDNSTPGMWFEDAVTLHRWAERGRQALEALGLEASVGVDH